MSSASSSCDRFRARLESTMLGPLSPPAASAPWHGAQRASNCFLPASIRSARGGCCAAAQIRAQHTIRIVLIALATPLAYVALPRGETEPDLTAKTRRAQRVAAGCTCSLAAAPLEQLKQLSAFRKLFVILRVFVVDWARPYHKGAKTQRIARFLVAAGLIRVHLCSSVVAFILLVRPVLGADLFVGDGHQVALRANQQHALRNGRRRHANFTHAVLRQELILRPRLHDISVAVFARVVELPVRRNR